MSQTLTTDAAPNTPDPAPAPDDSHGLSIRALTTLWSCWLLGSWAIILGMKHHVTVARGMAFAGVLGMMLCWPALRLSLGPTEHQGSEAATVRPARVFLEWSSLFFIFQAVLWPLRTAARWELAQTLWLDAAIAAWGLITAAIVAWGCRSLLPNHRVWAMVGCVLLLLGEPVLMAMTGSAAWFMRVSPIQVIWVLSDGPVSELSGSLASHIIAAITAAIVGWVLVIMFGLRSDNA